MIKRLWQHNLSGSTLFHFPIGILLRFIVLEKAGAYVDPQQ